MERKKDQPGRPSARRDEPGPAQLSKLLRQCGISLAPAQIDRLWAYHELLRQYNPELNLTRIHNFESMVQKLYVDSILPGLIMRLPSPLLDLGTGPGMPGIPLKIAFPDLEVVLAESRRKRVEFLNLAVERLKLKGIRVLGKGISPKFDDPVAGVITRAVESIPATLERVSGCVAKGGIVLFMKGPQCDGEVQEALTRCSADYRLVKDHPYHIPHTEHARRLVVFERVGEPLRAVKEQAMRKHTVRAVESEQNELFKDLKKLLTARGIKKQGLALVSGSKIVLETLKDFPDLCEAWISSGGHMPPPTDAPGHLSWYQLASPLFALLDTLGTAAPLLLVRVQPIEAWSPEEGLPHGCSLLIPFQDPENVGAVIRSAVAFGARQVILLSESAHPYHPKSLRASGGAVLRVKLLEGPSIKELPEGLPLVPLSVEGEDISRFYFPETFAFLPGIEGPGLPEHLRVGAASVPIAGGVESLNAATATAIALFVWAQSARGVE